MLTKTEELKRRRKRLEDVRRQERAFAAVVRQRYRNRMYHTKAQVLEKLKVS